MKSYLWIWAVVALIAFTLPFDPFLNRAPVGLIVFCVATVICTVALDKIIKHDMVPPSSDEGGDQR